MHSLKTMMGAAALGVAALIVSGCNGLALEDLLPGDVAEERQADVSERLAAAPDARILVLGDSVMWWGEPDGQSIGQALARTLGEPVVNLSVPGARISHPDTEARGAGFDIRAQFVARQWDWVVIEGGANDLGDECGCNRCDATLDQMIAADGKTGEWVNLLDQVRQGGARAVLVGYHQPPISGGEDTLAQCGPAFAALNERLRRLAAQRAGVTYVTMGDVVDPTDLAAYDPDRIHPSARSSRAVAGLIGSAISQAEDR